MTREDIEEKLDILRWYGNSPDIRSVEFRKFVLDEYDKGNFIKENFVRNCIEKFRQQSEK